MTHTRESLLAFTERVKAAFLAKQIHAPVHLCSETQIEPLLRIFEQVRPQDWVFSTWRSIYHALLKGIPEQWVFDEILAGRSMCLMNREHRFFSSAIVGGALPIACGVAMGVKRSGGDEQVWCFVGDMTARTGVFHEFEQYCVGHELPVRIVVEDNGYSTNTPTEESWGTATSAPPLTHYLYQRTEPHVGVGTHVTF
jgi:TPP-dependent pyruvate/acetoin dehydrogenase alpha subunit